MLNNNQHLILTLFILNEHQSVQKSQTYQFDYIEVTKSMYYTIYIDFT